MSFGRADNASVEDGEEEQGHHICHQAGVKALKNTFINPITIRGQYYNGEVHSLSHCQHVLITYPVSFLSLSLSLVLFCSLSVSFSHSHSLRENASYYAKAKLQNQQGNRCDPLANLSQQSCTEFQRGSYTQVSCILLRRACHHSVEGRCVRVCVCVCARVLCSATYVSNICCHGTQFRGQGPGKCLL